ARPGVSQQSSPTHDAVKDEIVADSSLLYRYLADIAVVDVPSGAVHRPAVRAHAVGFWISPDGRQVAYSELAGFIANTQQGVYSLRVAQVPAGASEIGHPRTVVPRLSQEYGISV